MTEVDASPSTAPMGRSPSVRDGVSLAALAALVHAPSLFNGLTNWDDPQYVSGNPIAASGARGLWLAISAPFDDAWYPLTQLGYLLLHALAGPSPFAHHLAQPAHFAMAAALVPAALSAFGVPRRAALVAAVLWIVHPFRVESVAWAANLKDTLSLPLVLAAFALYGRGRPRAGAFAFASALLAKSMVFPVALLLPLAARRSGVSWREALRRAVPWLLPAGAVAVVALMLHLRGGVAHHGPAGGNGVLGALPTALWLPWWYLGRVVWPAAPRAIYDFAPVGPLDWRLGLALALWTAFGALLWWRRRECSGWVLGAAAWLLPLAAVLGLVPLGFLVAERYTLLPSLALAAAIGLAVEGLRGRSRAVALTVVSVASLAMAVVTVHRQRDWRDAVSLWEANRTVAPNAAAARFNLAGAYGAQGRWKEAAAELETVRRLDPHGRVQSPLDVGLMLFLARMPEGDGADEALAHYQRIRDEAPRRPEVLLEVASDVLAKGHVEAARALLEPALHGPLGAAAHLLLARAELDRGDLEQGIAHTLVAVDRDAAHEGVLITLAVELLRRGEWLYAERVASRRCRSPRTDAILRGLRAAALEKLGS
ncbi:MAG: tetratricopeptide repeat protein, partial [Myxococcales bacterium]